MIKSAWKITDQSHCFQSAKKYLRDEMFWFLTENNLISYNQSGKPGESCISQLLSITHKTDKSFDDRFEVRGFFLAGIYPSSFTNVHFWTKIEFSNVLFHNIQSQNCKMQVRVQRSFKLWSWFMAEPWWEFRK